MAADVCENCGNVLLREDIKYIGYCRCQTKLPQRKIWIPKNKSCKGVAALKDSEYHGGRFSSAEW